MSVTTGLERSATAWYVAVVATITSTCALDIAATAAGTALVVSSALDGAPLWALAGVLLATYAAWATALKANVVADWRLLEKTGVSTNILSKAMFEFAQRRSAGYRAPRVASAVGYVGTELAKELPYYAGAFGAAFVSDAVGSTDALIFLAGTNIGAAVYEYGLARLSRFVTRSWP